MAERMVRGNLLFLVAISMKVNSRMGNIMAEEFLPGLIQTSMRVNLKMEKNTGMEYIFKPMGASMLGNSSMA